MSNNSTANAGSGGDTFNTTDLTTFTALSTTGKAPGSIIYVGATSSAAPTGVTDAHPFPVTVRNSGGTELALATTTKQDTGNTSLASIDGKITAVNTGAVVVSSSALPSGASTAAKQPALGTAGAASTDVLTVQGIASMTAIKVDGSAVTQPVSGTFWQATQPVSLASSVTVAQATASNLNATVVGTGTFAVQATQSGTWTVQPGNTANTTAWLVTGTGGTFPATQSGTWNIGTVTTLTTCATVTSLTQFNGNAIDTNSGNKSVGTLRVVLATDQPSLTNAIPVTIQAATTGGATPGQILSAASNNATSIKASAGTLKSLVVINTNATIYYLKFYDKASAPAPASDTPLQTIPIPANASGAGVAIPLPPEGIGFSLGIAAAIVGGIGTTDNTNAATGIAVSYSYK